MLRYTLALPKQDNSGRELTAEHRRAAEQLLHHFGAFTAHEAVGAWRGTIGTYGAERVTVYTVDAPDTSESYAKLHALAQTLKVACEQDAIYLTRQPVETWLV